MATRTLISELAIKVTVSAKQLRTGLGKAMKSLKAGAAGIVTALSQVTVVLNQGIELFQKFAGAVMAAAKSLVEAGRAAEQLGTSTQQVRELASVFQAGGMDFEGAVDALVDMRERIAEAAAEPEGGLAETFQAMGLAAEELVKLSPEEQLKAINREMRNMSNASERIFALRDAFGDEAAKGLLSTLDLSNQQIDDMMAKFRETAGVVSDVDAIASEQMLRTFNQLRTSITEGAKALLVQWVPHLQAALEVALKIWNAIKGWIQPLLRAWAIVTPFVGIQLKALDGINERAKEIRKEAEKRAALLAKERKLREANGRSFKDQLAHIQAQKKAEEEAAKAAAAAARARAAAAKKAAEARRRAAVAAAIERVKARMSSASQAVQGTFSNLAGGGIRQSGLTGQQARNEARQRKLETMAERSAARDERRNEYLQSIIDGLRAGALTPVELRF